MKRVMTMLSSLVLLYAAGSLRAVPVTSGLVLELDADAIPASVVDSENKIGTWIDSSGQGNDAQQTSASSMPAYVANSDIFKGHAAVSFDGGQFMTLNNNMLNVGSFTMFAVGKYDRYNFEQYMVTGQNSSAPDGRIRFGTNSNSFCWRVGNSGEYRSGGDTNTHVFSLTSTAQCYLDGAVVQSGSNTSTVNPGALGIGSYNRGEKAFMEGDVATILMYNRLLTPEEIDAVNSWLINKYTVSVTAPTPANGATAVGEPEDDVMVTFQWDAAPNPLNPTVVDPEVKKHLLYINGGTTDPNMYKIGEVNVTDYNTKTASFGPVALDYDKTYSWRVVEALSDGKGGILADEDPNNYVGDTWTFSTLLSVPDYTVQPQSVRFTPGETVTFTAEYTSLSPVTAVWYKDEQPITIGGRFTLSLDDSSVALEIQDSVLADEGNYYCILTSEGGSTPTDSAILISKKLLAGYEFENGLVDTVGTNDGTAVGGLNIVDGKIGEFAAESADGSGYILLSVDAYPKAGFGNGMDQFTYSFWIKPSAVQSGEGRILGCFNLGNHTGMQVGVNANNALRFYMRAENEVSISIDTPTNAAPDGVWSYVTLTYDGANLTFFVNGEINTTAAVAELTNFIPWEYPMTYMSKNSRGTMTESFVGQLDSFNIYNYAMDEYEVADIYVGDTGKTVCIQSQKPEAKFDFNNDCAVNIQDFAMLANSWLSCGLYPQCVE